MLNKYILDCFYFTFLFSCCVLSYCCRIVWVFSFALHIIFFLQYFSQSILQPLPGEYVLCRTLLVLFCFNFHHSYYIEKDHQMPTTLDSYQHEMTPLQRTFCRNNYPAYITFGNCQQTELLNKIHIAMLIIIHRFTCISLLNLVFSTLWLLLLVTWEFLTIYSIYQSRVFSFCCLCYRIYHLS